LWVGAGWHRVEIVKPNCFLYALGYVSDNRVSFEDSLDRLGHVSERHSGGLAKRSSIRRWYAEFRESSTSAILKSFLRF